MYLLCSITRKHDGSESLYPLAVSESEAYLMDYAQGGYDPADVTLEWHGYCGLTRSQEIPAYGMPGTSTQFSISQTDYLPAKPVSCIPAMDFDA